MWKAQDNYWRDFYDDPTADFGEQWYIDREAVKKVAANELYTAMVAAETAFYGDETATPVVAGIL